MVAYPSRTDPGGRTLNSVQAPGTGELGSVRKVLTQNRVSQELYATDISKFFTSFLLSPADSSLRRTYVPKGGGSVRSSLFPKTTSKSFVNSTWGFGDASAAGLAVME